MAVDFIPEDRTTALLDSNDEVFKVYSNIMLALANQVRRITNTSAKLGVEKMAELLANVVINVDTSDATAIAEYILKDYTAYINGKKVTGTMPYINGKTIVPSEHDVIAVPAGTYVKGDIIVKAVQTDTPSAPDVPDEPENYYDVVSSAVVVTSSGGSGRLEFTFPQNNRPVSYRLVENNTSAVGDISVTEVAGEFTFTSSSRGTATANAKGFDNNNDERVDVAAEATLGIIGGSFVCTINVTDAIFDPGEYTLNLYYPKEA